MFTNPSDKLKTGAALIFAIQVLGAVGLLIFAIVNELIVFGIILAGVIFLSAWYTAIITLTWCESAEYAEQAAQLASECVNQLKHIREAVEDPSEADMPTWKKLAAKKQ